MLAKLEAFIAPPFSRGQLESAVAEHETAAHKLIDLLQRIEGMDLAKALVEESLAYGDLQGGEDHGRWLSEQTGRHVVQRPGEVVLARNDDILSITLDRPWTHNAFDRKMRDDLHAAFELAALDPEIERVIWRGQGKAFCVGADLAEFGTTRDPALAHEIRMQTLPAHSLIQCGRKVEVQLHGACIGAGLEMAAFAQRVAAKHNTWFQLPELAMGLIPGAGGCLSIPRRIGWQRTALLVLSGKRINAEVALSWGLIDAIIDD